MKPYLFSQKTAQFGLINLIIILVLLLGSCRNSNNQPTVLTVFAAASLTEAFTDMALAFEKTQTDVDVLVNFAGSQTLRLQLSTGAKADILAVANQQHIAALHHDNLVGIPVIFTYNELTVIVPANNPANIHTLADLAQPNLKLVLAGPDVPVGRYSRKLLQNLNQVIGIDYADTVLANLVSEEDNVKGIVGKVVLGEADAGIVYRSDVFGNQDALSTPIEISAEDNIVAQYPMAKVINSSHPALAERFMMFVLSAEGQAILKAHGFKEVEAK